MVVKLVPESGVAFEPVVLNRLPITIGRSDAATLCVPDRWVSRVHCEIVEVDGQLTVRDLGSKHGTMLNGEMIRSSRLQSGDRLTVGTQIFRLVLAEAGEETVYDSGSKTATITPLANRVEA